MIVRHLAVRATCALLACVALGSLPAGCERSSAPRERSAVLRDDATMAVLNAARALHHQADLLEASGDYAGATRAIERVLTLAIPSTVEEGPEIRLDAQGRLAELSLSAREPDAALRRCDEVLREGGRESVLLARIHLVRGRALRALSERAGAADGGLAPPGDDGGRAASLRAAAIEALERSIEMNQRVLARAGDGGA